MSVGDADGEPAGVTAFDGGVDEHVDVSVAASLCASVCVCVCGCGCVCGTALAMAADDTKAMQGAAEASKGRRELSVRRSVSRALCLPVSQVSKQRASSRPAAMLSPACECSSFAFSSPSFRCVSGGRRNLRVSDDALGGGEGGSFGVSIRALLIRQRERERKKNRYSSLHRESTATVPGQE